MRVTAAGRGATAPVVASAPVAGPVRLILYVAALLVFLAGMQLFVFPLRTDEYFAWTIGSPMTAVFLGASYWSAVGLELTAARAQRWVGARIALPAVFTFTTITLVVTLVHLDLFHLEPDFALRTRFVTWAWIAVYALVPILMVLAALQQRRLSTEAIHAPSRSAGDERWVSSTSATTGSGLPTTVRAILLVLALALTLLGIALLVDPLGAASVWAWPLTELTGRAIGAWLVGLGVAAGHARLLDDRVSLQPLAVTGVLFGVLQTFALLRHGDELDWDSPESLAYCIGLTVLTAVSAWALWPRSHTQLG